MYTGNFDSFIFLWDVDPFKLKKMSVLSTRNFIKFWKLLICKCAYVEEKCKT